MATIFRKILCPIDFSDNSLAALDEAAKLAQRDDTLLYVLNVEFLPLTDPEKLADYVTASSGSGRPQLEQVAQKHLGEVRHELLVRSGWPAEVIEKVAQEFEVDLIVMATHGRTGISRLFLGSIAEHVLRTSGRPTLSFGPGTTLGQMKTILCPVNFNPNSVAALTFGGRLAQEFGAELTLLHVISVAFEPPEVPVKPLVPEWEQDARAQARLAKVAAEHLGATAEYQLAVRRGTPAREILEFAKELRPDLIVMATHGRRGLSHVVWGSVAERMVRESTVPMLTVRGQDSPA